MKTPRTKRARPAVGPAEDTPAATTTRRRRRRSHEEDLLAQTDTAFDGAIAERAHELFLSRGGVHGHDLDDWLEAERQLRARQSRPN